MEKNQRTTTGLELEKIKEIWAQLALTAAARARIEAAEPILAQRELSAALRETTESRQLLEKFGTPPLVSLEGMEQILQIAEKGDMLSPEQLEQVEGALAAVRRMQDYLSRGQQYQIPLAYYGENLQPLTEIREQIHQQIRNGQVEDHATRELFDLRCQIQRTQEKRKEKAESVLRTHKECMSDSFCVMRGGHLCVPVKKEYKFRISGSVIDKSSTGNTLFIEPAAVQKYEEELSLLLIQEDNEVRRILYTLTVMIGEQLEAFRENSRIMERLDYAFSKGKLSIEWDCVPPSVNTERRIRLVAARHPLMDRTMAVPLDFALGEDGEEPYRGVVITGPNTGGKTVALKTVALCCMLAQWGLHVPCREAQVCMNSQYLCDIGDGQSLSENLSTFSAHITNVLDILGRVNAESLVIMDELGSGTDPAEGMGIAVAILEALRESGCLFLVTTHYPEVKEYAARTAEVINARMTFDQESLQPLYRMVIGEAGESCAFAIAKRLGMSQAMLDVAQRAAYGSTIDGQECDRTKMDSGRILSAQTSGGPHIQKDRPAAKRQDLSNKFRRGDSVMLYPDHKIGIVCEPVNDKGCLRVQLPDRKIWINHKRVKLHVAADELYPEDYDFSIVFDTVENRKKRHDMERKYTGDLIIEGEE
ncbi:MAG: DNA mismatch repair protein MutS [Lachnospiraceae bacterium]|nr:DNA mismatch repair protein MutS [Lachnospiraceae bacterium]